jgi:hypothetical protein
MRSAGLFALLLGLSSTAHAAPPTSCVVVRKPTAQQREQSAGDVERLLDAYEAESSDNTAWPAALLAVFDRFPLPSVNVLVAQHHPLWRTPEKQLVAYVEAAAQDPGDYADRSAVARTIERVEQTLLPEVRNGPLLVVEARGVARREEIASLDVRIGGQACTGDLISAAAPYSVSWIAHGRRLTATVAPSTSGEGADQCLAIEGEAVGPCSGRLRPIEPTVAPPASPASRSPAPRLAARSESVTPPSIDIRFAIPGLALAAVGFGLGAYARDRVETYMDRAEPECHHRQCSAAGMKDVLSARDWKTTYYVAGAGGLLGLAALAASGHRYYADWLFPSPEREVRQARQRLPGIVPIAAAGAAGLGLETRF